MYYFAYGSNMDHNRLAARIGAVRAVGRASLPGYDLVFNKLSADGSGKANIVPARSRHVEGVVFELSDSQFDVLDRYERGYRRAMVSLVRGGLPETGITYLAEAHRVADGLRPTCEYLGVIRTGAALFGLTEEYQRRLADQLCLSS